MLTSFSCMGSLPMSAFLAYLDRRLERLFHLLEKGTLDKRRRTDAES